MIFIKERVGKLISDLKELIYTDVLPVREYRFLKTQERFEDIRNLNTDSWSVLKEGELWGGHREYFWFETVVTLPESFQGKCVVYELKTGREGEWDATNPQFSIFVNGKRIQGLDVNHREVILTESAKAGESFRIVLSAFTGDNNFRLVMDSCVKVLHRETEKYYYDISVPYEVARLLPPESREFRNIILTIMNL